MRAYIPVVPSQIEVLLREGRFRFAQAFVTTRLFFEENSEVDEEEREFELSLLAAQASREIQESQESNGYVLAVNLTSVQSGSESGSQVELLSEIEWSQVDAVLIAQSEEGELTWFASQEVQDNLPSWLTSEN